MKVFDLDGTIRNCRSPWNKLRDNSKFGIIRFLTGQIAALTAKKVNINLPKENFLTITGSPSNENFISNLWLKINGINTKLLANPFVNRLLNENKPTDKKSGNWKNAILQYITNFEKKITFYEDNLEQMKYIKNIKVKIKRIKNE